MKIRNYSLLEFYTVKTAPLLYSLLTVLITACFYHSIAGYINVSLPKAISTLLIFVYLLHYYDLISNRCKAILKEYSNIKKPSNFFWKASASTIHLAKSIDGANLVDYTTISNQQTLTLNLVGSRDTVIKAVENLGWKVLWINGRELKARVSL